MLASVSILVTLLYNHMIEPKVNQNVQVGNCVDVGSVFFANMKEIKMLKIILRRFEGMLNTIFMEGARSLCLYHSWFQTGQTFCISVFFSEV